MLAVAADCPVVSTTSQASSCEICEAVVYSKGDKDITESGMQHSKAIKMKRARPHTHSRITACHSRAQRCARAERSQQSKHKRLCCRKQTAATQKSSIQGDATIKYNLFPKLRPNNTVSRNEKFWVDQVTTPPPPRGRTRGGEGQGGGGYAGSTMFGSPHSWRIENSIQSCM